MINWLSPGENLAGFQLKSPVSGMIKPLTSHSELIYNANVLPQALCVELQQGTLIAPFSCHYDTALLGSRRLIFKHKSGLTLQVDLAPSTDIVPAQAIKHLVSPRTMVSAGQAIIRLDMQQLSPLTDLQLVVMVLPHPVINAVFSCERYVEAGQDTLFTIQLKTSTT